MAKGGGPSVSGHTNLTIGEGLQTTSFHAREKADGTVTGSLENKSRDQEQRYHGAIDCLRIEGNNAWLSGYITDVVLGPNPDFVIEEGYGFWLRVVDNGEGANSPADQWTDVAIFVGYNPNRCNISYGFSLVDNEAGNVQVKP
jgi:hypothetical protein